LALGVPVVVLFGLAVGYYRLVYFERVAALHVPAGATFALRVDVEQVVLFEPIRKNLLPVLDAASDVGGQTLSQRLQLVTGINLAMDLREILFAIGPGEDAWLLVLSGLFPKHALRGVTRVMEQDAGLRASFGPEELLHLESWAMYMTQAPDGSFLVSNEPALLQAARQSSDSFRALGLSRDGVGSVATVSAGAGAGPLAQFARARAEIGLAETITLTVEAKPFAGAAEQGGAPASWLAGARLLAAAAAGDGGPWLALRPGLARAEVLGSPQNHWVFRTSFERHEVDTWLADLAVQLSSRLGQRLSQPQTLGK
jgi:hypothetical protein